MRELLIKLQSFPKTWERLRKFIGMKLYFFDDIGRGLELQHSHDCGFVVTASNHEFNGLLTDFCDGEGYFLVIEHCGKGFYWAVDNGTSDDLAQSYYDTAYFPSRQEAFNQGVVKAFSLMEERNK